MNKYWPVIMWFYDVTDGGAMKYKPSASHQAKLHWCYCHEDALRYGLYSTKDEQRANLGNMPTFIVKVIKSKTKPNVGVDSTLRLLVQRIDLNQVNED